MQPQLPKPRMNIGVSVAAGLLSTIFMIAPLLSGSPGGVVGGIILNSLTTLPLFLAGFGWGLRSALAAGVIMLAATGLALGWVGLLVVAVLTILPVWALIWVGLEHRLVVVRELSGEDGRTYGLWLGADYLMLTLIMIGVAMMLVVWAGDSQFLRDMALAQILQALQEPDLVMPGTEEAMREAVATLFAYPALIITGLIMGLIVNGILAQGILTRFHHALRPSPRLAFLSMPPWFFWSFAALGGGALLANLSQADEQISYILRNLLIIASIGYFFTGLGVVHGLSLRYKPRVAVLVGFYGMLLIPVMANYGDWTAMAIIALGLVDNQTDFRGLRRNADPNEPSKNGSKNGSKKV